MEGDRVEAVATDLRKHDEFELARPPEARGWRAFVRGAVAELRRAGIPVGAARVEISGNVPRGGGLSSSAALEVALTLALIALAGVPEPDRVELAKICSKIENDWVGAQTGLLDQLASLLGEDGSALRIDFKTLDIETVPLELGGWQLVTADSGAAHSHAEGGYNERRAECRAAAEALGVEYLSDADPEAARRLGGPEGKRARHVLNENQRVEATVAALHVGDFGTVGRLLDASHASLRDDFEASVPEVEATVERLKRAGAAGARMMGGGFGGAVLALLPPRCPRPDGVVPVAPGPAARRL
jgi:galactokinase